MNQFGQNNNFNSGWNAGRTGFPPSSPTGSTNPRGMQSMQGPRIYFKRMVMNEGEIQPNEVPMGGDVYLFIKNDWSCIYACAWNANGGMDGHTYVLNDVPAANAAIMSDNDFQTQILNRLDQLEANIASKPNYNTYNKKNRNGSKSNNGGDQK